MFPKCVQPLFRTDAEEGRATEVMAHLWPLTCVPHPAKQTLMCTQISSSQKAVQQVPKRSYLLPLSSVFSSTSLSEDNCTIFFCADILWPSISFTHSTRPRNMRTSWMMCQRLKREKIRLRIKGVHWFWHLVNDMPDMEEHAVLGKE